MSNLDDARASVSSEDRLSTFFERQEEVEDGEEEEKKEEEEEGEGRRGVEPSLAALSGAGLGWLRLSSERRSARPTPEAALTVEPQVSKPSKILFKLFQ